MEKNRVIIAATAVMAFLLVPALTFAFSTDVPIATQLTNEEMQDIKGGAHSDMGVHIFK